MALRQVVIDMDKEGRLTSIILHRHKLGEGPTILLYNPPTKWDFKIPMPDEKHNMAKKPILKKRKIKR